MGATDGQLVRRVQEGDREAFGELVDRYRDMVYGLGYHLTGEFEAARDLAQEAFIQAYLRLAQLRDPEKFAGWLRHIVLNVHRSQRRRREVVTVALEAEAQPPIANPEPSEIEAVVREALSRLREPERLALTLHYINGYSHAEIGGFLGVRRETVKTRLARARQHLREEVMAMVKDAFEGRKLPEQFTHETVSEALRLMNLLADELVKNGAITDPAVESAFRKVPRHLFIDKARMYFVDAGEWREIVRDHRDPDPDLLRRIYQGHVSIEIAPESSMSDPECMAWMMEDLSLRSGMKVLEIGAGSGYNAALIAEVVGSPSLIYTVELNDVLAESARRHLNEAGYGDVHVIHGDGAEGFPAGAPYDAIVVTCGAMDLSPAWMEQLADSGAVLCPLRIPPSGDPTLLVHRSNGQLQGRFTRLIYFVPMRGDRLLCQGMPGRMDVDEARALGDKRPEQPPFMLRAAFGDPKAPPRWDRNPWWSFFFFLSIHMTDSERIVAAQDFFPIGLADVFAREACIFSQSEETMEVYGGEGILSGFNELALRWQSLGCPRLEDYRFTIVSALDPSTVPADVMVMARRYYKYLVTVGRTQTKPNSNAG